MGGAPASLHELWGFYTSHGACMDHLSNMCVSQDIPTASTTIQEAPRMMGQCPGGPAATMLSSLLPCCHHLCCPHRPHRHTHAACPNACRVHPPEPGSTTYNEQLWRHSQNEKIIGEMQTQAEITAQCQWPMGLPCKYLSCNRCPPQGQLACIAHIRSHIPP